jgi:hypothetical protein
MLEDPGEPAPPFLPPLPAGDPPPRFQEPRPLDSAAPSPTAASPIAADPVTTSPTTTSPTTTNPAAVDPTALGHAGGGHTGGGPTGGHTGATEAAGTTDTTGRAEPSGVETSVDPLLDRLTGIEAALTEFHRRSAHREAVIDRLHEDRLEQRSGVRRALLDPVVTDLLRLHDGLSAESARMAGRGDARTADLLASFADDVELALERCGFDLVRPAPGERFQSGAQLAASVLATDDPARHNTVAEVTQVGVLDRETGRMRRPARTRVFRHRQPAATDADTDTDTDETGTGTGAGAGATTEADPAPASPAPVQPGL